MALIQIPSNADMATAKQLAAQCKKLGREMKEMPFVYDKEDDCSAFLYVLVRGGANWQGMRVHTPDNTLLWISFEDDSCFCGGDFYFLKNGTVKFGHCRCSPEWLAAHWPEGLPEGLEETGYCVYSSWAEGIRAFTRFLPAAYKEISRIRAAEVVKEFEMKMSTVLVEDMAIST